MAWLRKVFVALSAGGLLAATAGSADASLIAITSGSIGATPTSLAHYDEFDTTLGTLDQVDVMIAGSLTVTVVTAPCPCGAFGTALPYTYSIQVNQDFFPGATGRGFDFATPAVFQFFGTATGAGETVMFVAPMVYSFSFTETSDLIGFTTGSFSGPVVPPAFVSGTRADFLPSSPLTAGLFSIETIISHTTIQTSGLPFPSIIPIASGSILVTYHYTPFAEIPEPGGLALLASGFILLAGAMRRWR